MKALIKIIKNTDGNSAVSAKALHEFLGYHKAHWAKWYKTNILNNKFAIEREDWEALTLGVNANGSENLDFVLTIDFAKKLSMMAKTQKGEEARDYFIECEKIAILKIPQSFSEALQLAADQARMIEEQSKLVENLHGALDSHMDFVSILKVATHNKVSEKNFDWRDLKKKCGELGYAIRKIQSNRFDYQNLYHIAAFKHCYPQYDYNFKKLIPELA